MSDGSAITYPKWRIITLSKKSKAKKPQDTPTEQRTICDRARVTLRYMPSDYGTGEVDRYE